MKKKAIEKIPYLGLKKLSRKKDVKYIGITEIRIVGHERHLFLEVYRNKKESRETPLVRIVLAKKDFGTYWPEKEEWTRQKIKPDSCYGRVIWGEEHPTWEQEKKENILQSTEDLERIKKFCKANVYDKERWWEYIYEHEDDIVITARRNRKHKAYMRRQEALADRMTHTKELPEKEILDRADRLYFHNQHYLYYKKHGCWAHSLQQVWRGYRCEMEKRNFLRKPVPELDGRTERGALWHLSNVRSTWRVQVSGKSERYS